MRTTNVSYNGSAFSTLLCSDEIRKHIDDSSVPFGLCYGLIPLAVLSLASSLSWLLLTVPSTHTSSCCITAKGRDSGSLCLSPLFAPFGSELYDLRWLLQLRGSVADLWSRGALWFACCRGKVHSREGPNAYDDMHMHMYVRAQITNMMTTITTNHSPNHKWKIETTKGGGRRRRRRNSSVTFPRWSGCVITAAAAVVVVVVLFTPVVYAVVAHCFSDYCSYGDNRRICPNRSSFWRKS